MEDELREHKRKLEHVTLDESAFYCVQGALPCTLHIENRVGLSIMNLLFLEGHSNCHKVSLHDALGRGLPGRWKEHVKLISNTVNAEILGTELNPSQ